MMSASDASLRRYSRSPGPSEGSINALRKVGRRMSASMTRMRRLVVAANSARDSDRNVLPSPISDDEIISVFGARPGTSTKRPYSARTASCSGVALCRCITGQREPRLRFTQGM